MPFTPIDQVMKRVEKYGDSDSALFTELIYAGEFIVKITTAALVAAIEDDREGHRYRLLHALVRADGVGEWASKLEEALSGPASQHLAAALADDRRVFTERVGKGSWQLEAVRDLHEVLMGVHSGAQATGDKASLWTWFAKFAEVRNKTRGHGAITPAACSRLVPKLKNSILLLTSHNPIFQRPWAYLHRNLSGKYRVVELGGDASAFAALKSVAAMQGENYKNGVYMAAGQLRRVDLLHSDPDTSDFFLPNGAFNGKTYELHSLVTDSRLTADAGPYLAVAGDRPASETEGKGQLDVVGDLFANLPAIPTGYVRRARLETEVREALTNDRHPVVTLVGRGGIGKTSLALATLHEIALTNRYDIVIWFSARDIDLTMAGPKVVQPRVLTERDIAEEYRSLVNGPGVGSKEKISAISIMAEHMRRSPLGPTLFVFDNFETVRSPVDLFHWIDTNIRLPNKAVITSRFREFKADFPIEVSGMEHEEADALISQTAAALKIQDLVSKEQREQIIEESDGHPYVIKIILGEIANTGKFAKPSNMIVRKDEILDALFERTYANLSPTANRVFLTLSGWRSLVPQLAVEAVLLRHGSDGGDPGKAIDELIRMSLVERTRAEDETDFLAVPLTASLFGKKKLEVSPHRELIENDVRFLQEIGATTTTGLKEGIRPRIAALFKRIATRIGGGSVTLKEMKPVLEFVARSYSPAWLLLADLLLEVEGDAGLEESALYVRRFLEEKPPAEKAQIAWQRLINVYRATNNVVGGCSAFLRAAEISEPPFYQISNMANWLNTEREVIEKLDVAERGALFKPMARLMEGYLQAASATDLSRLAWLHLHAGDGRRALEVAEIGLRREPDHLYCQRLVDKLDIYW
jgi:hypothetical protein